MDCKHWNDNWVAYLYDECSAEEHTDVERHLAECDDCRAHMNTLAATRRTLRDAAPEVAAPPRVIVLPAGPSRAVNWWGFAGGFASAAALFLVGLFVGTNFLAQTDAEPPVQTVIQLPEGESLDDPIDNRPVQAMDDGHKQFETGIQQVKSDYRMLDDRLGRIERWLPEPQGDNLPRLATEDRVQVAVGNLSQEFDVIRTRDLQLLMQAMYAAEQTARQRDVTLSQAMELLYAETNPNVSHR